MQFSEADDVVLLDVEAFDRLPPRQRLANRIADLLWLAGDVLKIVSADDAEVIRCFESDVQHLYDQIDHVMTRLSD